MPIHTVTTVAATCDQCGSVIRQNTPYVDAQPYGVVCCQVCWGSISATAVAKLLNLHDIFIRADVSVTDYSATPRRVWDKP